MQLPVTDNTRLSAVTAVLVWPPLISLWQWVLGVFSIIDLILLKWSGFISVVQSFANIHLLMWTFINPISGRCGTKGKLSYHPCHRQQWTFFKKLFFKPNNLENVQDRTIWTSYSSSCLISRLDSCMKVNADLLSFLPRWFSSFENHIKVFNF